MMPQHWYVGPWVWDTHGSIAHWRPPVGAVGALDLRSIPQQSTPAVKDGRGIFVSESTLGSDYDLLGTGGWSDIKTSQALRSKLPSRDKKRQPQGDDLLSHILDAICDGSDPTGDDFARPLMPDDSMRLVLAIGGHKYQWKTAPWNYHWDKIQDVERKDFQKHFDRAKSGKMKDGEHHRRILDALCEKYNLIGADDWKTLVPSKLRSEIPGRLKHETTITDDFTRANGTTIGNLLTWTEIDGDLQTNSNNVITTSGLDVARAESDLSSADNTAQIVTLNASDAAYGVICRHSSSVKTGYYGQLLGQTSPDTWRILKRVTGTFTQLYSATNTHSANDIVKLNVSGSAVEIFQNGTSRVAGTDTSITGNVRCGILGSVEPSTGTMDDFSASDIAASTVIYTRLEGLPRGITRGIYTRS